MKLTEDQAYLLRSLADGPRYGFTDLRTLKALERRGLAHHSYRDSQEWGSITTAGRALLAEDKQDA